MTSNVSIVSDFVANGHQIILTFPVPPLKFRTVGFSVQRPLARQRVMLSHRVFAYYGLMSPSRYLPPAYLFRPGGSLPYGLIETDTERVPTLLHVSFSPCRRPYPGSRMELRLFLLP